MSYHVVLSDIERGHRPVERFPGNGRPHFGGRTLPCADYVNSLGNVFNLSVSQALENLKLAGAMHVSVYTVEGDQFVETRYIARPIPKWGAVFEAVQRFQATSMIRGNDPTVWQRNFDTARRVIEDDFKTMGLDVDFTERG